MDSSPAAEIHLTAKKDRYSSILCGLGADKSQKPHFGEHDLLIKVDVEFSEDDFKAINELRGKISKLLRNVSGFKFQPKVNTVNRVQLRHEISQIMLEIFAKHRAPLGIIYPSNSEWNWKSSVKNKEAFESVYPRLSQVDKLVRVSESTRTKIIQRAEEINKLAKTNTKNELIKCHLCEEDIDNLQELQLHVDKKLHKERLMSIRESH